MHNIATHWLRHSFVVATLALASACASEVPVVPEQRPSVPAQLAAAQASARGGAAATAAEARSDNRSPELGGCTILQAPQGSKVAFHVYATGTQIYRWNGTGWSFVGPSAVLSADAGGRGTVGIHYAGPTWESVSGSKVVGAVVQRCTPDASSIPWLLLAATSSEGPGIFHRVTFIQRVNTAGGNAPSYGGTFVGEVVEVPYTTEYFFYRAQ